MIQPLFASRALYLTLALFFRYPLDALFPRLIARKTGADIKSVLRELKKLERLGIIRVRGEGRLRDYELDDSYPAHAELAALFRKDEG